MRSSRIWIPGALLLLFVTNLHAQMGMRGGPPPVRGFYNPVVGHGSTYEFSSSDGKKISMEIAVVGKESVNGKDGFWFENTMSNSPEGEMIMKHLDVLDGSDVSVVRMIIQLPGKPPMEMPSQMLQMARQKQPADVRTSAEDVGSETVVTPAGSFQTEHWRMKDGSGDVWISKEISPFGLVKYQGKDQSMVLTKTTTDAKDKITGTPQPFNPMMFGGPPQP